MRAAAAATRNGVQALTIWNATPFFKRSRNATATRRRPPQLLGIQRPTLYNKMKRYAIEL